MTDYITNDIPVSIFRLTGGLNTNGNPMRVSDIESSDVDNIDFDKFGRILKRRGYLQLNSTALT